MPGLALCLEEREEIRAGIERGISLAAIGRALGRSSSTISREVARNRGRDRYRAVMAEARAERCRLRPKVPKLVADRRLGRMVERDLSIGFSPAGIAARLRLTDGPRVCSETIYQALYSSTYRGISQSPSKCLRTRRRRRRRQGERPKRGSLVNVRSIDERPSGAALRTEAGHWEGDLLIGAHHLSAVITLVERVSRFTLVRTIPDLCRDSVTAALIEAFADMPPGLRRSLTWDRGWEMAGWRQLETVAQLPVYFCHPRSPWERPSNENTNRQLRLWLRKGTDLNQFDQSSLDRIATVLNHQPRRLFGWETSAQQYDRLGALIARTHVSEDFSDSRRVKRSGELLG